MKKTALAALCALLSACATTSGTSSMAFYRPRGAELQHAITAAVVKNQLVVTIDGEQAAAGPWNDDGTNIFGRWHERKIAAQCSTRSEGNPLLAMASQRLLWQDVVTRKDTTCTVYMDGDPAAQLVMKMN